MTRSLLWLLLVGVAGCFDLDREPPEETRPSSVAFGPAGDTTNYAATVNPAAPTSPLLIINDGLPFEARREYDFDGDGKPELLIVRAAGGPAWDALDVDLEIRAANDSVIYRDSLTTKRYMGQEPYTGTAQAEVDSVIRQQLRDFFADHNFMPTAGNFDDANISLQSWYGDSLSLDEFKRFEADLMAAPQFRYYIGGESSTGITWSKVLNRFVETWVCC